MYIRRIRPREGGAIRSRGGEWVSFKLRTTPGTNICGSVNCCVLFYDACRRSTLLHTHATCASFTCSGSRSDSPISRWMNSMFFSQLCGSVGSARAPLCAPPAARIIFSFSSFPLHTPHGGPINSMAGLRKHAGLGDKPLVSERFTYDVCYTHDSHMRILPAIHNVPTMRICITTHILVYTTQHDNIV
jgi:hypothetical protein